jgi:hypothetical protein
MSLSKGLIYRFVTEKAFVASRVGWGFYLAGLAVGFVPEHLKYIISIHLISEGILPKAILSSI